MVQINNSLTPPTVDADPTESNGDKLYAAIWTLTGISAFFLALRLYTKIFRRKGLWWDDYILLFSWCLLFSESNVNTANIKLGFGHHLWTVAPQNLEPLAIHGSIAHTLTLLASTLSKTAFAVTLLRLTDGWLRRWVWICIGTLNLFALVTIILVWTQCTPARAMWNPHIPGKCMDVDIMVGINVAFSVYSGVVDILLCLVPWKIIWGLKMRMKEKIGVGVAMSMGILAGIAVFIKCAYLPRLKGKDFPYNGIDLIIWGNTETAVTIIATSIPVLRALFAEVRLKTGKSSIFKSQRAPSCVFRRSLMPLGGGNDSSAGGGAGGLTVPTAARTANSSRSGGFDRASLMESGYGGGGRRGSRDSLADLEAPLRRTSLEKRQQKLDEDRTAIAEARIVQRYPAPVRGRKNWPVVGL